MMKFLIKNNVLTANDILTEGTMKYALLFNYICFKD